MREPIHTPAPEGGAERAIVRDLLDFLNHCHSCYHTADQIARRLEQAGYTRLREDLPPVPASGGKYYLLREGCVIAFRLPRRKLRGFLIAAAHTDSPSFRIRQAADVPSAGNVVRLGVEPYGGGIWRSWLDRPLTVAGRVVIRERAGDGGNDIRLVSRLVYVDRDLLVIPSLAIHMNREVNRGAALQPQTDLLPVLSLTPPSGDGSAPGSPSAHSGTFRALIARTAGAAESDLLETELFLVPRAPATLTGLSEEFVASHKLDDLQSVYGCMRGFLLSGETPPDGEARPDSGEAEPDRGRAYPDSGEAADDENMPVLAVFNHEEVGSGSCQGADGTILSDLLRQIAQRAGTEYSAAAARSFLVSADNAHAIHPAHPEYADRTEYPVLGGGVVIKYNANQKYTTDAVSAAVFAEICRRAGVPVQRYSNRADLPGGSTLGHIATAQVSVRSVDIGLAQLAMHSAYELAAAIDTEYMVRAMTAYFSSGYRVTDGAVTLGV